MFHLSVSYQAQLADAAQRTAVLERLAAALVATYGPVIARPYEASGGWIG